MRCKTWIIALGSGTLISVLILILAPQFLSNLEEFLCFKNISIVKEVFKKSPENSTNKTIPSLSKSAAVQVIKNWLYAKKNAFTPPYNRLVLNPLTTGTLKTDLTKPGGSIDWLVKNNAYYQFGVQEIKSIDQFVTQADQAIADVKVLEDQALYVNGKLDHSKSEFKVRTVRYSLKLVDGIWKIAEYKEL